MTIPGKTPVVRNTLYQTDDGRWMMVLKSADKELTVFGRTLTELRNHTEPWIMAQMGERPGDRVVRPLRPWIASAARTAVTAVITAALAIAGVVATRPVA